MDPSAPPIDWQFAQLELAKAQNLFKSSFEVFYCFIFGIILTIQHAFILFVGLYSYYFIGVGFTFFFSKNN